MNQQQQQQQQTQTFCSAEQAAFHGQFEKGDRRQAITDAVTKVAEDHVFKIGDGLSVPGEIVTTMAHGVRVDLWSALKSLSDQSRADFVVSKDEAMAFYAFYRLTGVDSTIEEEICGAQISTFMNMGVMGLDGSVAIDKAGRSRRCAYHRCPSDTARQEESGDLGKGTKACTGCNKVRYCSDQCSRDDWLDHKVECCPTSDEVTRKRAVSWMRRYLDAMH
mmetsp:Transcript_27847/g.56098  ORF Transcript_27847/g.56098 Transcript_27847/m.56098 type:complete len:220 (+) Transcript_27847:110-769(+)